MHALLLLGGVGLASLLWSSRGNKLPPGQNPFDAFPVGVNRDHPLAVDVFTGSSKHRYTVTSFAVADGRSYFVAEKKGDVDWISYFVTPAGARIFWAANADQHGEIDEMKADFSLGGVT